MRTKYGIFSISYAANSLLNIVFPKWYQVAGRIVIPLTVNFNYSTAEFTGVYFSVPWLFRVTTKTCPGWLINNTPPHASWRRMKLFLYGPNLDLIITLRITQWSRISLIIFDILAACYIIVIFYYLAKFAVYRRYNFLNPHSQWDVVPTV